MTKRDLEIANLIYAGDLTSQQIADRIGLSETMIRKMRTGARRPEIRQYIDGLGREALEQDRVLMMRAQRTAGRVLVELLDSTDPRIRIEAARAIRQEVKGLKLTVENRTVTPADASRMFAERFHGAGGNNGN